MKVFLCGGGDGQVVKGAYNKLNSIIDHKKPLLYVPLAMPSTQYPDCLKWITQELKCINVPNIEMSISGRDLASRNLNDYCAIFIGGGNTFKLLKELKDSGSFLNIQEYLKNDGIVFGGSAGAIIFGANLNACMKDDDNDVGLKDINGFHILRYISILCHYTNRTKEKDAESTKYLLELSKKQKCMALPEEDTLFFEDGKIGILGDRPFYVFDDGHRITFNSTNNRLEEYLKLKNANELMDFMNDNITYGWLDKNKEIHINNLNHFRENYRISSIEESLLNGLGTCIEQAKIIKYFLDRIGLETKLFCHRCYETEDNFNKDIFMHCFVLFKYNNKWYHFEHSNQPKKGIHEYDSVESAIHEITSGFEEHGDIRELTEIPYIEDNLTFKEFNEFVNSFDNKYQK